MKKGDDVVRSLEDVSDQDTISSDLLCDSIPITLETSYGRPYSVCKDATIPESIKNNYDIMARKNDLRRVS